MKRSISATALLLTSISAIIGSGWLFSSYYAATLAGPAAILSWVICGIGIIIVAFVFSEVCTLLPITGSTVRIPLFTHGTVVSFIFSWIVWVSYVSSAPIETQAVVQYLNFYFPSLNSTNGGLTINGYIVASVLMVIISTINIYSLRWLIRFNSFLTVVKIAIPLIIAAVIMYVTFSVQNMVHPANSQFMPLGIKGVFAAIVSGGIMFAFNGFKQAAELAGEAKNPKFAIPFAIIGSVVICLLIFLILQVAFLGSLRPQNLISGWQKLSLSGNNSPLASMIYQNNLKDLSPLLYICAIIAPFAAALMYCSIAGRALYGMSKNNSIPAIFSRLSTQGNPIYAIALNFVVGMFLFAPLPGWKNMVEFLSTLIAVTYSMGPISLVALRHQLHDHKRVFKLPFGMLWATIAFYICTLLIFWCGWDIISKLDLVLVLGLFVLVTQQKKSKGKHKKVDWHSSIWLWSYFAGLSLISYFSEFGGGKGRIAFGWDFLLLAIFSGLIVWLSLWRKLPTEETKKHIAELQLEM